MDGQVHPLSRKSTNSNRQNTEERAMTDNVNNSMGGGGKNGDIVPDNAIKGEKTIVCWNCQTVLMVKEDWNVVQCTNCDKINRIPNAPTDVNNQIRINDSLNHFDLYLPYVVFYSFKF